MSVEFTNWQSNPVLPPSESRLHRPKRKSTQSNESSTRSKALIIALVLSLVALIAAIVLFVLPYFDVYHILSDKSGSASPAANQSAPPPGSAALTGQFATSMALPVDALFDSNFATVYSSPPSAGQWVGMEFPWPGVSISGFRLYALTGAEANALGMEIRVSSLSCGQSNGADQSVAVVTEAPVANSWSYYSIPAALQRMTRCARAFPAPGNGIELAELRFWGASSSAFSSSSSDSSSAGYAASSSVSSSSSSAAAASAAVSSSLSSSLSTPLSSSLSSSFSSSAAVTSSSSSALFPSSSSEGSSANARSSSISGSSSISSVLTARFSSIISSSSSGISSTSTPRSSSSSSTRFSSSGSSNLSSSTRSISSSTGISSSSSIQSSSRSSSGGSISSSAIGMSSGMSSGASISGPAAPRGNYSGSRYTPRFTLPTFVTYNTSTGLSDFTPAKLRWMAWDTEAPSVWVLIPDTGSTAGNKAALQTAINNVVAASGTAAVDSLRGIRLQAGVEYGFDLDCESVALTAAGGAPRWLYIESETVGSTLRPYGERVGYEDAPKMAKGGQVAYNTQFVRVSVNTQRIRLAGLHLRVDPTVAPSIRAGIYGYPGTGERYTWSYEGLIGFKAIPGQTSRPRDIIIDRCIIEHDEQIHNRRALNLNMYRVGVLHSWIENPGDPFNSDSQAIAAQSTPGDIVIYNNEIASAWGENIAIAGATLDPTFLPRDVVIKNNLLTFRLRWSPPTASNPTGQNRLHKNAFETKAVERVLIEANEIENIYTYGRQLSQYHTIVIKASDDNNNETWASCRDITVRVNRLTRVSGLFNFIGSDRRVSVNGADHRFLNRVECSHNINLPWDQTEFGLGFTKEVQFTAVSGPYVHPTDPEWSRMTDISFHSNTIWGCDNPSTVENYQRIAIYDGDGLANPPMIRFEWQNNVMACVNPGPPGWFFLATPNYSSEQGKMPFGWMALDKSGTQTESNFASGVTDAVAQLKNPWGISNVGFATFAELDLDPTTLALRSTSPGKGIGSGGGDPGVDHALLNAALARTRTGRSN